MFRHKRFTDLLSARSALRPPRAGRWDWLKFAGLGLLIFVVTTLLVAAPFGYAAARAYDKVLEGKDQLAAAEQSIQELDFTAAVDHIDAAIEVFGESKIQISKLRYFSAVPWIAAKVDLADRLLSAGSEAAIAMRDVLVIVRDISGVLEESEGLSGMVAGNLPDLGLMFKDLTVVQKREILAGLAAAAPRIRASLEKLDLVDAQLSNLPDDPSTARIRAVILPLQQKLAGVRADLARIQPLTEILPAVLGHEDARNYLVIFQNNTELRPTGGFLSMIGTVGVKDAELSDLKVEDVYAYDVAVLDKPRPLPPELLRKYLGIDRWYLRDANWSPDFPTAIAKILEFYDQEASARAGGRPVPAIDGVIAVTPRLASDLLGLAGPITVDGQTFTAANLVDKLEFQVEKDFATQGIPAEQRKDIVGKLMRALVDRITQFPLTKLLAVVALGHQALAEGDVLLYSADSRLQTLILENDWGGKLKQPAVDYVAVIDANLASLKTDAVMERAIAYSVAPGQGGYVGKVAITYKNNGSFTWKTTRYRTYTRVYVPAGSELLGVAGAMKDDKLKDPAGHPGVADQGDELGRRWFGTFIAIEPGQSKTLEFSFRLAPSVVKAVERGTYILDVEKQPGTVSRLTLDLGLGKKIRTAEPPEDPADFGDDRYRFRSEFRSDRHFRVEY